MKKSNKKGFTLVELVVVIAIIGILAAILVPTMMNYVKKAKLKTANSNAKLVFTTANNCIADLVSDGKEASVSSVSYASAVKSLSTTDAVQKAIKDALSDNGDNAGFCAFNINGSQKIEYAQWATSTTTGAVVGQWPNPKSDVAVAEDVTFGTYNS